MKRREFCKSALTTAIATAIPGQYLLAADNQYSSQAMSSVQAINISGEETTLVGAVVNELRDSLRGKLLLNGDTGYDHARAVWNAMINKHPALIARCEGAAGDLLFAWEDARNVLNYYAEYGNELPDEMNMNVTLLTTPDSERRVAVEVVWSGDHKDADKALKALRGVGKPLADTVKTVPYTRFQRRGDNSNRHGVRQYMKSSMVNDFSENLVNEIIEIYRPNPMANFFFMQAGGAVSRIASTDTAFPHRSAHCNMMRWNKWFDPETKEQRGQRIADVKADWAILEPFTHGFYVNLNDDDEKKTHANYGHNYDRLVEVKNKYDPTNLLRLNANIKPTI